MSKFREWFVFLIRIAIGCLFVVSGHIHFSNPIAFYETILTYKMVSGVPAFWLAQALPLVMMVVGTWVALNLFPKISAWFALFLMLMFLIAQTSAYARGLGIDCGCFGYYSDSISWLSVSWIVMLLLCSLVLLRENYREELSSAQELAVN